MKTNFRKRGLILYYETVKKLEDLTDAEFGRLVRLASCYSDPASPWFEQTPDLAAAFPQMEAEQRRLYRICWQILAGDAKDDDEKLTYKKMTRQYNAFRTNALRAGIAVGRFPTSEEWAELGCPGFRQWDRLGRPLPPVHPLPASDDAQARDSGARVCDNAAQAHDSDAQVRDNAAQVHDSDAQVRDNATQVHDSDAQVRDNATQVHDNDASNNNSNTHTHSSTHSNSNNPNHSCSLTLNVREYNTCNAFDTASAPGTTDASGTTGTPGTTDAAGTTGTPGTTDTPGTRGTPGTTGPVPPHASPPLSKMLSQAVSAWSGSRREKRCPLDSPARAALETQVRRYASRYGEESVYALIQDSIAFGWKTIPWERLARAQPPSAPHGSDAGRDREIRYYVQNLSREQAGKKRRKGRTRS